MYICKNLKYLPTLNHNIKIVIVKIKIYIWLLEGLFLVINIFKRYAYYTKLS